ncbi:hypothetical protein C8R44DRAFT_807124 [Mycena epipterygia]|nr:hypothetical protein C8R44DRAFT_807124 [Mycena epipterygia]
MHHALGIHELVENICDHLLRCYPKDSKVSPGLNAFARTSKFFLGPALDQMWMKQYTLINVFNCMPSDLWAEPNGEDVFRLIRPITAADWSAL